jgi:hypothetical protein
VWGAIGILIIVFGAYRLGWYRPPVAVMAVIFTAIQASTWFWARSIALAAAQEGADAQRAYNAAPGAGQARAQAFITSTGPQRRHVTVTHPDGVGSP